MCVCAGASLCSEIHSTGKFIKLQYNTISLSFLYCAIHHFKVPIAYYPHFCLEKCWWLYCGCCIPSYDCFVLVIIFFKWMVRCFEITIFTSQPCNVSNCSRDIFVIQTPQTNSGFKSSEMSPAICHLLDSSVCQTIFLITSLFCNNAYLTWPASLEDSSERFRGCACPHTLRACPWLWSVGGTLHTEVELIQEQVQADGLIF